MSNFCLLKCNTFYASCHLFVFFVFFSEIKQSLLLLDKLFDMWTLIRRHLYGENSTKAKCMHTTQEHQNTLHLESYTHNIDWVLPDTYLQICIYNFWTSVSLSLPLLEILHMMLVECEYFTSKRQNPQKTISRSFFFERKLHMDDRLKIKWNKTRKRMARYGQQKKSITARW